MKWAIYFIHVPVDKHTYVWPWTGARNKDPLPPGFVLLGGSSGWRYQPLRLNKFSRSIALLKWAMAHGCPWNYWTCWVVAAGGHPEVLQWAREHGCPWEEVTAPDLYDMGLYALGEAAEKGDVVGRCKLKPVETSVESAWFPLLDLTCDDPL